MVSKTWIRRLFTQKKSAPLVKASKSGKKGQIPLHIENLELRQLLSVAGSFNNVSGIITLTDDNAGATNLVVGQVTGTPTSPVGPAGTYVVAYNNGGTVPIAGGTSISTTGGTVTGVLRSSVNNLTYAGSTNTNQELVTLSGGVVGGNSLGSYTNSSNVFTGFNLTNNATGGTGGVQTLHVGSTNSNAAFIVSNSNVTVTGLSSTSYSQFGTVTLLGGSGSDSFNVTSFTTGTGILAIDGAGGTNTIVAANDLNYSLSSTTLSRAGLQGIAITNIGLASLTAGANDNTFNITGFTGSGTLNGGGGNDVLISANGSYSNITLTNTALAEDTQNFSISGFSTANLSVATSNTTFNLNGWTKAANINGGTGNSTLAGPNGVATPNLWNFTGLNTGTINANLPVSTINFSNIKNAVGGVNLPATGNENTFRFSSPSSSIAGNITGAGNDTLNYTGYGSPATVNFGSNSATAIFSQQPAGFSGITGFIGSGTGDTFIGLNSGFNTFNINGNDSGNDVVTGGLTYTFASIANLQGGSQGNAFNFTANGSHLDGNILGIGNDNLSFAGHQNTAVAIQITNEGTNNNLSSGTYVGFSGTATSAILGGAFSGIKNLTGTSKTGASGDTLTGANGVSAFHIFDITANDSGTYANQGFTNKLTFTGISNLTSGNDLGDRFAFHQGLTVSGGVSGGLSSAGGSLDYSALTGNVSVVLTSLRNGSGTGIGTSFTNIRQMLGETGTPTNVTLTGPSLSGPLTWNISASNAGDVTDGSATFDFTGAGNLTGGSANDTFVFQHNLGNDAGLSGVLNGGAGNDVANYSALTGNLSVNLSTNVLNMETVIGGSGTNTLTGYTATNFWNINTVNGGTVGPTTFSSFQNLHGNTGGDTFGFSTGGSLSGAVIGVNGVGEALDFSNDVGASPLNFTLSNITAGNGSVSLIGGGFTNIHNLQGTGNGTFASNDTLTGDNSFVNFWAIIGNDSGFVGTLTIPGPGTIQTLFNFAGIANLHGGSGIDKFAFGTQGLLLGTIDGGAAAPFTNILDMQNQNNAVSVNLQDGSATPIFGGAAGGFANISNFVGNYLGGTLTGRDVDNNWTILGDGNGTINTDHVNFNQFSNLNGGTANDTFTMSADPNVPSVGHVQGHVWGGSNNIIIEPNNGNNLSGHDVLAYDSLYVAGTGNAPISVDPSAGTASGIANGIASMDAFSVAGNNNTLTANNAFNDWEVFAHNAGTLNGVPFSGFQNLVGGTGCDTFHFTNTSTTVGSVDGTIDGGAAPGTNSLSYSGANFAVTVNAEDQSATNIRSNAAHGFANISNFTGNANPAIGSKFIGKNVASTWAFSGTDQGSVSNDAGTNNAYNYSFAGFSTLMGGTANDTFVPAMNIVPTPGIDGGAGFNTLTFANFTNDVVVTLGTGLGQVTNIQLLNGGMGNDTLIGDNSILGVGGHYMWHLRQAPTNSFVADNANDNVMFFNKFENLTGSDANDTFFFGAGSSVSGNLNGGNGSNTLDFGTDDFGVPIKLDLGAGTITTNIPSSPVGNLAVETFSSLVGSGVAGIGGDSIVGSNGNDNAWFLVGQDAGTVAQDRQFTFTGVANLFGGDGNDIFSFGDNSQITGTIDGELGLNALDYHLYTTPVAVDLANSSASHIFSGANGGFANISLLTGTGIEGALGDTLTGYLADDTFVITGNDTGNVGGMFTYTGVANLHGNAGNDVFSFDQGGSVSGSVDGEANTNNSLDFSNFNAPVNVNLANHAATPIANYGPNGFANISSLTGTGLAAPNDTTLFGANESNFWDITGTDAGNVTNVTGTFAFSGVANLVGNYKDDYFKAEDGQNVTGFIDGGQGEKFIGSPGNLSDQGQYRDILDYSAWTNGAGLVVDLRKDVNLEEVDGTLDGLATLQGPNQQTLWQISGINGGKLYYTDLTGDHAPDFLFFSNLAGGAFLNTFQVTTGALTPDLVNPGTITGGTVGTQTLDFSQYDFSSVGFVVNSEALGMGQAQFAMPAINFIGINNLIGTGFTGPTGDTLTSAESGGHGWFMNGPDTGALFDNALPTSNSIAFSGIANLNGAAGNDTFHLGAGSSISGLVNGGGGTNTLDYTMFNASVNVTTGTTGIIPVLTGSATAIDHGADGGWSRIQNLFGTSTGGTTTLHGSDAAISTGWNVTSPGSGTETINLVTTFNFAIVNSLIGGAQTDTFTIRPGASLSGLVDGGAGSNTLDYSPFGSAVPVTVDLGLKTATNIGSFANMTTINGPSALHGSLVGASSTNIWTIGTLINNSDAGNINGINFTNFKNLTGGTGDDTYNFAASALFNGFLTGTVTDLGGANNALNVVTSGSFVLSNTSITYGSHTTGIAGSFATSSFSAIGTGTHNFDVGAWSNGLANLNGSTSGTDVLKVSTAMPATVLTNTTLAIGASVNAAVGFHLTDFEAAQLTNTDTVGADSNIFDISGWTGSRTTTVTGSLATGTSLVVKDDGNITVDGTKASATVTRTVGGNVTLMTNVTDVQLTDNGSGNRTLTFNNWDGTGSVKGTLVHLDTFVYQGNNGNMAMNNTSFVGAASITLSQIFQARLQNTQTANGPGVIINANGFTGSLVLIGGAGNDLIATDQASSAIVLGGEGNDTIFGSSGFDILVGGSGTDTITGRSNAAGGTILIGGTLSSRYFTESDPIGGVAIPSAAQLGALGAVMSEWASNDPFATKITRLLNGGPRNGLNELNSFPPTLISPNTGTVFDDGNANVLNGDAGHDWYMYGQLDLFVANLTKDAQTQIYTQF